MDEEESGFCCWVGLRREQRLPIVGGGDGGGVGVHADEGGVYKKKKEWGVFSFVVGGYDC